MLASGAARTEALQVTRLDRGDVAGEETRHVHQMAAMGQHHVLLQVGLGVKQRPYPLHEGRGIAHAPHDLGEGRAALHKRIVAEIERQAAIAHAGL